ncbi:MAG: TonB family protein [Deferribacteraceae bacterium]|jgi:protein TonB|nr:TonB family protein [Deferribacteraceae bacterium]
MIRSFAVSALIHVVLVAGLVFGSSYFNQPKHKTARLEMSSVIFEKPEEPAPAPVAEEPKKEVKPPPPKPKPPKPKPIPKEIPKEIKPKAEERSVPDVALPIEMPTEPIEESAEAEGYAGSEGETSDKPQEQSSPQGSQSASTGEGEVRVYLGKNFNYIQRRVAKYTIYPPKAKRSGIKGKLTVAFTINTDGTVSNITITESSGYPVLDDAGTAAVKNAAPFPIPPSSARIAIPISFDLI